MTEERKKERLWILADKEDAEAIKRSSKKYGLTQSAYLLMLYKKYVHVFDHGEGARHEDRD